MQEKKLLSLRDILSAAEAVSQEEMDELLGSQIEDGEEFLCDLPEDLTQIFCLGKRYHLQAQKIIEDHSLWHRQGEVTHCTEDCSVAHAQALQNVQQGRLIQEIFWLLAGNYAGVSQSHLGIRKGGALVEIPEEGNTHKGLLVVALPGGANLTQDDVLRLILGEDPE